MTLNININNDISLAEIFTKPWAMAFVKSAPSTIAVLENQQTHSSW